jgi:hypothetical protein
VPALLREALRKSNKVGVAKVVIQAKQHLAILIPCGRALVLSCCAGAARSAPSSSWTCRRWTQGPRASRPPK